MIICVANQKGGVGKTTTTINLSSALSRKGFSVLLVDIDPQGNASSGLGLSQEVISKFNLYDVLVGKKKMKEIIQTIGNTRLSLAPTNSDLVGVQVELVNQPGRENRLKGSLSSLEGQFDFIFIDCPPSLGLLTVNSFVAADKFLVPLQCEYYALEGLSQLLLTAGLIRKNFNPFLELGGILLTMFDKRSNLNHQVVSEVRSHFRDKVFKSVIPRNVRLSEAPGYGQSIFDYDENALGAIRYHDLASEIEEQYKEYGENKKHEKNKKYEKNEKHEKNKKYESPPHYEKKFQKDSLSVLKGKKSESENVQSEKGI